MESPPAQVYKVRDLSEAAAILCCGIDLLAAEQDTNGRVYFVFPDTVEVQSIAKAHWACTLDVKSRYYSDATKTLKNVIYRDRP